MSAPAGTDKTGQSAGGGSAGGGAPSTSLAQTLAKEPAVQQVSLARKLSWAFMAFVFVPYILWHYKMQILNQDLADRAKSWEMDIGGLAIPQLACLLVFSINAFVYLVLEFTVCFDPSFEPLPVAGKRLKGIDSTFGQIHLLTENFFKFSVIMYYGYMCERHPPNAHGSVYTHLFKHHDEFWFVALGFFAMCYFTFQDNHPMTDALLNRDQSEEWKGWMQFLFVEYHYFHNVTVYNPIRLFVSSYVWMTGFGNFSFFYVKADFGFVRFAQMMWRLNFLVLFLCAVHNNHYILYYIVPLHTFYFLTTFGVMYLWSEANYTWNVRIKLLMWFAAIFVIWDVPGMFEPVFFFLPSAPRDTDAPHGIMHEWHFRSYLDHFSTAIGMIFALNFPVMEAWIQNVEKLSFWPQYQIKGCVACIMLVMSAVWMYYVGTENKFTYNARAPYSFFIPMLTYIFIRNMIPEWRKRHCALLVFAGKITLETYLMQHHILLTKNAKGILILVADWPLCNLLLVACIYVFCAYNLYRITLNTRALIIPNNIKDAKRNLVGFCAVFFGAAVVGAVLQSVGVRHGYLVGLLVLCVSAVLCLTFPFADRTIPPMSVIFVTIYALALIMFATAEFGQLQPLPQVDEAALAARRAKMAAKPAFVGTNAVLGTFTCLFAALMILSYDSYLGVSMAVLRLSGVNLHVQGTYDALHTALAKAGLPVYASSAAGSLNASGK